MVPCCITFHNTSAVTWEGALKGIRICAQSLRFSLRRRMMSNSQRDIPSSSSAPRQPQAPYNDPMQIDGEEENEEAMNNSNSSCCVICGEPLASVGHHQACCLGCGHMFGFSCINRWIQEKGSDANCPVCRLAFTLVDVRRHFALPVVLSDRNLQERNRHLEDENRNLMLTIQELVCENENLRDEVRNYEEVVRYFGIDGQ